MREMSKGKKKPMRDGVGARQKWSKDGMKNEGDEKKKEAVR